VIPPDRLAAVSPSARLHLPGRAPLQSKPQRVKGSSCALSQERHPYSRKRPLEPPPITTRSVSIAGSSIHGNFRRVIADKVLLFSESAMIQAPDS
jgi:hypothetical protein